MEKRRLPTALVLAGLLVAGAHSGWTAEGDGPPLFLDTSQPVDVRAKDLVSRMTLEEKVAQTMQNAPAIPRLGLPAYKWWNECLHGVGRAGRATVFPQAIGLAATFDPALVREVGAAISDEARAKANAEAAAGRSGHLHGLTFWTPNINIFRDPRWGRGQETYGEDPYLTSRMGVAFVEGLQGDDPRFLKVAACAKHYAVHSGPEGLRHSFDAVVSRRDMAETYLPAFRALVEEADVESVMCAYNRTNGEPCCGSPSLLREILREGWGFDGHVVSDCGAIEDIDRHHGVTRDRAESAALALRSGTNLNCGRANQALVEAVERGLVTEEELDASLATLLATRFRLGLFDPSQEVPYTSIPIEVVGCEEHRALARRAAAESVVVLKNEAGVLPLATDLGRIFVTGPMAADVQVLLGNYYGVNESLTTILEGIVGAVGPVTVVEYRQGTLMDRENVNAMDWFSNEARRADVTIAVMGISGLLEGEEGESIASSFRGDRLEIGLPPHQIEFLKTIREKAETLVVVLTGGSALAIPEVHEMADAVVMAWYPGQEGGHGVADVLFGKVAPSGKLPVTVPVSTEQLPPFDDYSMTGRTYRYMTYEPLYPFGFGLSTTTFRFELAAPAELAVDPDEPVEIRVQVTNTGSRSGTEVVQLYVSGPGAGARRPIVTLAGLERVSLAAGESRIVTFAVSADMLMRIDDGGETVLDPGIYTLTVGGASPGLRSEALGAPEPVTITAKVQ